MNSILVCLLENSAGFCSLRALVSEPSTLVLDEPTSGLDLNATFLYLRIIRKLMHSGKQLVLVTHHIHEIPPEVTFVVLLNKGRIEEIGEKQNLLTDSKLSNLYGTAMKVISENGYFQADSGRLVDSLTELLDHHPDLGNS